MFVLHAIHGFHPWLHSCAPLGRQRAAFGAGRAHAHRIRTAGTQAAPDANPPPHRPRHCEQHPPPPSNRSVEDRVDREAGPEWVPAIRARSMQNPRGLRPSRQCRPNHRSQVRSHVKSRRDRCTPMKPTGNLAYLQSRCIHNKHLGHRCPIEMSSDRGRILCATRIFGLEGCGCI